MSSAQYQPFCWFLDALSGPSYSATSLFHFARYQLDNRDSRFLRMVSLHDVYAKNVRVNT